jgi:uncharacterized membrane protein HdeD (DUF308 family)
MNQQIPDRKIKKYIDPKIIRRAAHINTISGALVIVLSGVFLFTLPANTFYIAFLLGFYLFFPGILISASIVSERTARNWVKFLPAYWLIKH